MLICISFFFYLTFILPGNTITLRLLQFLLEVSPGQEGSTYSRG